MKTGRPSAFSPHGFPWRQLRRLPGTILIMLWGRLACHAHEYHEYYVSVTRIEYNAPEHHWEISIRVFTDDLEKALLQKTGKRFTIRDNDGSEPVVSAYLEEHFQLYANDGTRKKLVFVGKEQEMDATWIYLELTGGPAVLRQASLRHDLLMEVFDSQTNIVNIKSGNYKKTFLFRKSNARQPL